MLDTEYVDGDPWHWLMTPVVSSARAPLIAPQLIHVKRVQASPYN